MRVTIHRRKGQLCDALRAKTVLAAIQRDSVAMLAKEGGEQAVANRESHREATLIGDSMTVDARVLEAHAVGGQRIGCQHLGVVRWIARETACPVLHMMAIVVDDHRGAVGEGGDEVGSGTREIRGIIVHTLERPCAGIGSTGIQDFEEGARLVAQALALVIAWTEAAEACQTSLGILAEGAHNSSIHRGYRLCPFGWLNAEDVVHQEIGQDLLGGNLT